MRRIFLDVGGHRGQTIEEVSKPLYHFDEIHCFEPLPQNCRQITARFGAIGRLNLHGFGLSDKDATLVIYERKAGDLGASTKRSGAPGEGIETECSFVDASRFFRENIRPDDAVLMKLNCEGAECDILNALIDSGEIAKVRNVMIDFDVRKFEGLENEEQRLLDRLETIGFDRYSLASDVMVGRTHQERIANWIRSVPAYAGFRDPMSFGEQIRHGLLKAKSLYRRFTRQ